MIRNNRYCLAMGSVLALTVVLVAACSSASTSSRSEAASQGRSSVSSSATKTSQEAAKPSRAQLPSGNLYRNLSSVYSGCKPEAVDSEFAGTAELFDTVSGQLVDLPQPKISDGDELLKSACTVTTAADGTQRVIYLVYTRTPSQGLTPESEQARLYTFAPSNAKPLAVKDFPLNADQSWRLYPGSGSFIAFTTDSNAGLEEVAFFNPDSLDVMTHIADPVGLVPRVGTFLRSFNYHGIAVADHTPAGDWVLRFVSGTTGQDVGSFPDFGDISATEEGFLVEHNSEDGVRYFNMKTNTLSDVVAPYLVSSELMHSSDQLAWQSTPERASEQTYGDHMILFGNLDDKGDFLSVLDLKEGRSVFTMDAKQLDGLGIKNSYVAGQYLYLEKKTDHPVIDFLSSQVASEGWSLLPKATLAGGWSVILTDDFDREFGSSGWTDNAYLARGEDGKPYSGPWF